MESIKDEIGYKIADDIVTCADSHIRCNIENHIWNNVEDNIEYNILRAFVFSVMDTIENDI